MLIQGKTPAEVIFIILGQGPLIPIWGLVAFGELEPLKLGELYRQRAERAGQTLLAAGRLAGRFRQRSRLYSERAQVRPLSLRQHPLGRHLGERAVAREAALLVRRVNTTAETLNPRTGVAGPARALPEEPCRPLLRKLAADIAVEDGCRIPFRIGQHQLVLGRGRCFGILQLLEGYFFALGFLGPSFGPKTAMAGDACPRGVAWLPHQSVRPPGAFAAFHS
jgi:hypothetical protein